MIDETQRVEDWELLAHCSQSYRALSDSFMDQIQMHRTQAMVLCRLFVQEGIIQSEIAQQLSVQGATITDILQRMEEAGLISRRRDPEDNRLVRVYLTDAGRDKERFIIEQFLKLEDTIFADFKDSERAQLRKYLTRVLKNMNQER